MTKIRLIPPLLLASLLCLAAGCHFASDAHKSIYAASQLGDGAMKGYAVWWKDQTNHLGDTPALEKQRQDVSAASRKVGVSLAVTDQALADYETKAGTNPPTKEVISALIATAVQDAGKFAATVGEITGMTNLAQLGK